MRYLLFISLLLCSLTGWGQITAIASVLLHSAGATAATLTSTVTVTTGATSMSAIMAYYPNSSCTYASKPTISDALGSTWIKVDSTCSGSNEALDEWVCYPCVMGSNTFSVTCTECTAIVGAFSNVKNSANPIDKVNAYNSGSGNIGTAAPGSITPSKSGSLVIAAATFSSYGISSTTPSGYTYLLTWNAGTYSPSLGYAYKTGSLSAENPTFSISSGLNSGGAIIMNLLGKIKGGCGACILMSDL